MARSSNPRVPPRTPGSMQIALCLITTTLCSVIVESARSRKRVESEKTPRLDRSDSFASLSSLPLLKAAEVLHEYNEGFQIGNREYPDSTILGFVTPWNKLGTEIALREAERRRLDIVAPVTFQVLPNGVKGGWDFDDSFYVNLTRPRRLENESHRHSVRVYPRFVFEEWSLSDFRDTAHDRDRFDATVTEIVNAARSRNCVGVVIEIWQALMAAGALLGSNLSQSDHGIKQETLKLVRLLGERLQERALQPVLVLPPYDAASAHRLGLTPDDFRGLRDAYEYFVVMTYDFSVPGRNPGPIAPLGWCEAVITYLVNAASLGSRVLLGLNFYGVDFRKQGNAGRHIIGHEYISLLQEYEPDIVWLDDYSEDAFTYEASEDGSEHLVFYPTRRSIRARIELAHRVGCGGIAIWELGQGLNYFMNEI